MNASSPLPLLHTYVRNIEAAYRTGQATEHTYRSDLQRLIETLAPGVTAINEPKRIACGAPDLIVTRQQTPLGYIETKDIGISLNQVERSEQMKRYLDSLGNLILTDYLEFRWYVAGQPRMHLRLTKTNAKAKWQADPDGLQQFGSLLQSFMLVPIPTITSPKDLAMRMAALAQLIRDTISRAFRTEEGGGSLHTQMEGFRRVLLPGLDPDQFADMYAQTICYGLFAARCNSKPGVAFTREHAAYDIPKTNPFLRKMFGHIAGSDLDDRIAWAVDDLAEALNRVDITAILRDFGKRTRQEDPVVHFYETFLAAYDPKMREARGVYYTPEPVVSYMVRSVDHLLKQDFGLADGLTDASKITITSKDGEGQPQEKEVHKVQILDPATGTGTFLYSIIDHIHATFKSNQGMWSGYVSQHLLPRLFGFELLMAPYAVAHMKLGLQLAETRYDFHSSERLGVYLTNTLEGGFEGGQIPFAEWLVEEAAAGGVKYNAPVMVVIGNPPYSYESKNIGPWISALVRDYYQVDGQPLKERNPKGLRDDYVKFIRFAQWRIQQTGYGILAYISNHRYLTNPTFPGMRQSLMNTFDRLYLLNLHGSTKPKEIPPPGVADQNVFDIQQGVSIGIFVKYAPHNKKGCTVSYADLWGPRESKYAWLSSHDVATTAWQELTPRTPVYSFIPQDRSLSEEYESGWKLTAMMPVNSVGLYTARDGLAIRETKADLRAVLKDFISLPVEAAREKYNPGPDSRDWQVALAQKDVRSSKLSEARIQPIAYRPFDTRFTYYTGVSRGLICMPRPEVMQHMIAGGNQAICFMRNSREQIASNFFAARHLIDKTILSSADNANVAPLYLYPDSRSPELFDADTDKSLDAPGGRRPNLSAAFLADMSARLNMRFVSDGRGDLQETFGPEDVFDYMYAVFYSPAYRARYVEFLTSDFPYLPLTTNTELFRALCQLGTRLVAFHTMDLSRVALSTYPVAGNNLVEKIEHRVTPEEPQRGRVYINETQYIEGVSADVWEFQVGGYQVCHKWLKDRRGRTLSYEDIRHYQCIVTALAETISLMEQIDEAIEEHGGWPIM